MEVVKMYKASAPIRKPRLFKMLKRLPKLVICFALCLCLVVGYSYKKPVEVHATAVAVVGSVVVGLCLSALGITVGATVGNETCKQIYDRIWTNGAAQLWDNGCYAIGQAINVTPALLTYVGNEFISAMNVDDYELRGTLPDQTLDYVNPKINYDFIKKLFGIQTFTTTASIGYDYFSRSVTDETTLNGLWIIGTFDDSDILNDKTLAMRFGTNVVFSDGYKLTGGYIQSNVTLGDTTGYFNIKRWTSWPDTNKVGLNKYILAIYQTGTVKGYVILCASDDSYEVVTKITDVPVYAGGDQSYLLDESKIIHDGKSIGVGENTPSSVTDALKDKVGVTDQDGKVTIPLNNTGSTTDLDSDNTTQSQSTTAGADIATEADKAASEAANEGHDTSVPKPGELPDLALPEIIFKEKFPFCLPWDLYLAFSNLAAPAAPPKWEIPFEIQSLNLRHDITIDFSQFDTLAAVLRWGLSVAFVIWLILLTRKIIGQ